MKEKREYKCKSREKYKPFYPIIRSLYGKTEMSPEQDLVEEVVAASLLEASDKDLKEDT